MSPGAGHRGGGRRTTGVKFFCQGNIRAQNSKSDSSPRKVMQSTKYFTALNRMQPRSSHENSVRPSVRCVLCDKTK